MPRVALVIGLGLTLLLAACSAGTASSQPAADVPEVTLGNQLAPDCVELGTCTEVDEVPDRSDDTQPTAEPSGTYDGIAVGFTDEGHPYLGDPDAPVTLVEFSDYLCPFCGRHFSSMLSGT